MTTTPDSFSTEQLELALKTAVKEDEVTKPMWEIRREANPEAQFNGMDIPELKKYCESVIDGMFEEQPHVMAAKYLACRLLANIAGQQQDVAEMLAEDGDMKRAATWMRDAGRIWAIQESLRSVDISDADFIAVENAEHVAGYHGLL